MSHPSRVRGLKYDPATAPAIAGLSHPSRVRGLKYQRKGLKKSQKIVAPLAGAWIEIV